VRSAEEFRASSVSSADAAGPVAQRGGLCTGLQTGKRNRRYEAEAFRETASATQVGIFQYPCCVSL
jgi:hypothetical protein